MMYKPSRPQKTIMKQESESMGMDMESIYRASHGTVLWYPLEY